MELADLRDRFPALDGLLVQISGLLTRRRVLLAASDRVLSLAWWEQGEQRIINTDIPPDLCQGGVPLTLTLNNAPAKDALMALARPGGYGFVYISHSAESGRDPDAVSTANSVSIAFQNETYSRALNGVLLAAGLQGKLDGKTLLVGSAVSAKTFGPQVSKVY